MLQNDLQNGRPTCISGRLGCFELTPESKLGLGLQSVHSLPMLMQQARPIIIHLIRVECLSDLCMAILRRLELAAVETTSTRSCS